MGVAKKWNGRRPWRQAGISFPDLEGLPHQQTKYTQYTNGDGENIFNGNYLN
jgi:hypothetical protein